MLSYRHVAAVCLAQYGEQRDGGWTVIDRPRVTLPSYNRSLVLPLERSSPIGSLVGLRGFHGLKYEIDALSEIYTERMSAVGVCHSDTDVFCMIRGNN